MNEGKGSKNAAMGVNFGGICKLSQTIASGVCSHLFHPLCLWIASEIFMVKLGLLGLWQL